MDRERALHDVQMGFIKTGSCINETVQGTLREDKPTYAVLLDVKKAYDTVWCDGLWLKLWNMNVKGQMWDVIKSMYEAFRNAVFV